MQSSEVVISKKTGILLHTKDILVGLGVLVSAIGAISNFAQKTTKDSTEAKFSFEVLERRVTTIENDRKERIEKRELEDKALNKNIADIKTDIELIKVEIKNLVRQTYRADLKYVQPSEKEL